MLDLEKVLQMENFLCELDVGKTCLLGSSSTVRLVPALSLPHHWAIYNHYH